MTKGPAAAEITASGRYGPIPQNFQYTLHEGYTALVGANNAGKSSLLQFVFRWAHGNLGAGAVCLIPSDREYTEPTTETGGKTLEQWNNDLMGYISGEPARFSQTASGPRRSELSRLLLHADFIPQVVELNRLLGRVGLQPLTLTGPQEIRFADVAAYLQGSGLRSLLPILAALTNPTVRAVLIDEPELSLEPRLQKVLRDLLVESSPPPRITVVATQSHLFLDRNTIAANEVVTSTASGPTVKAVETPAELYDVVFDLLGSSTEDLFFPRNYLITEGASDQVIVERVLRLLGVPSPTIKVLSARGIDAVRDAVTSVIRALVPLIVNDSPYASTVVALIDRPSDPNSANVQRLQNDLGDRLYVLDTPTIEEYIPEAIYERAGRVKANDVAELDRLRSDYAAQRELKREISNAVAGAITPEDFPSIPTIYDAAARAIAPRG